jgi:hypothetical protein
MEDGLVVETERGFFCAECARYVKASSGLPNVETPADEETAEEKLAETAEPSGDTTPERQEELPEDPVQLLKEIRNDLKPISRAVLYEKASVWNLIGGVGQIFALALLVLAVIEWSEASGDILLAAILVQLMTLTCFLRGK